MCEQQYEWVIKNERHLRLHELPADDLKTVVVSSLLGDHVVEVLLDGGWVKKETPYGVCTNLRPESVYRVSRKVTLIPLDIPWKHIVGIWKYAAMDENGDVFLYDDKPYLAEGTKVWQQTSGYRWFVDQHLNINTDGINWETSLTVRPEGE